MKRTKKMFSLVLALVMVLAMLPAALAADRTYVESKDPTCTEPGSTGYWVDEDTHWIYENETGGIPLNDEALFAKYLEPLGHSYENGKCKKCEKSGKYELVTAEDFPLSDGLYVIATANGEVLGVDRATVVPNDGIATAAGSISDGVLTLGANAGSVYAAEMTITQAESEGKKGDSGEGTFYNLITDTGYALFLDGEDGRYITPINNNFSGDIKYPHVITFNDDNSVKIALWDYGVEGSPLTYSGGKFTLGSGTAVYLYHEVEETTEPGPVLVVSSSDSATIPDLTNATTLGVTLNGGEASVKYDEKAVDAIRSQLSEGDSLALVVEPIEGDKLAAAEDLLPEGQENAALFHIALQVTSASGETKELTGGFNGGKATITVPYAAGSSDDEQDQGQILELRMVVSESTDTEEDGPKVIAQRVNENADGDFTGLSDDLGATYDAENEQATFETPSHSYYLLSTEASTTPTPSTADKIYLRVKWSNGATGTVAYGFNADDMTEVTKPEEGDNPRTEVEIEIPDGAAALYLTAEPGEEYFINKGFSNDGTGTYETGAEFAEALLSEDGAAVDAVANAIIDIEFDNTEGGQPQPGPQQGVPPYIPWITTNPTTPSTPATPTTPETKSELPFTDVDPDSSIYDYIKFVYENGIMEGMSDTSFDLYGSLTRGMLMTVLYRIEGKPAVTYTGKFSDVPAGLWYSDAIEWAASVGIANGYTDGRFGPNDPVTREQLAAFLYRYANWKGYDIKSADLAVSDFDKISPYAVDALKWAVENEVVWVGNAAVRPKETAKRWEIAVALYYLLQNVAK